MRPKGRTQLVQAEVFCLVFFFELEFSLKLPLPTPHKSESQGHVSKGAKICKYRGGVKIFTITQKRRGTVSEHTLSPKNPYPRPGSRPYVLSLARERLVEYLLLRPET